MDKRSSETFNEGSQREESNKEFNHGDDFDEKHKSKTEESLGSLSLKQIKSLIADIVMTQCSLSYRRAIKAVKLSSTWSWVLDTGV